MSIVNHWGKWVNSEIAVTGVTSANNIKWEIVENEICLTCEEIYEEFENGDPECDYGEGCHCEDFVECDSSHDKIFGDWKKNEEGKYEPDENGEFSAIIRESEIQVVWSKYTAKNRQLCSPCFPGQVDLDSGNGSFTGYTLPDYLIYKEE